MQGKRGQTVDEKLPESCANRKKCHKMTVFPIMGSVSKGSVNQTVSSYISEQFWNLQYSKTAPLSYQYRQRTPNERGCKDMILNLSGNRIASCWAV